MFFGSKIREQIISSFRAELAEHVQTLNNGLLALELTELQAKSKVYTLVFRELPYCLACSDNT